MTENYLVETDFLFALNPKDRLHPHVRQLLVNASKGMIRPWLSPVAPIEVSLLLKSRGFAESDIATIPRSFQAAIQKYTTMAMPRLEMEHLAMAAELRRAHPRLTFFDSIHAAMTLSSPFVYVSSNATAREVVTNEGGRARPLG